MHKACLNDIADPRKPFLIPLCDSLPLVMLCGIVSITDFSARAPVPEDYDESLSRLRLVFDRADNSFVEPLPTDPPHNYVVGACRQEEEIEAHGHIMHLAGGISGVVVHGMTF